MMLANCLCSTTLAVAVPIAVPRFFELLDVDSKLRGESREQIVERLLAALFMGAVKNS